MAKAVVIERPGGPEVLAVVDRPVREPGPGEVRIAVRAAAVNPTDIGGRQGGAGPDLSPPWVPGMDAAGTVESLGDGVERLRQLASAGRIRLGVAGEYPPEKAAEAQRVTEAGGLRGRAVIVF
jgi:NADPH:quinone reductase